MSGQQRLYFIPSNNLKRYIDKKYTGDGNFEISYMNVKPRVSIFFSEPTI